MTNLNIENPFTSDKISTVNFTSKKDALQILTKAHTLHTKNPSGISKEKRIKILENLHLLLLKNKNKLIELSVSEGGKPIQDTKLEMNRALEGVKLGIQAVRNIKGEMIPMNLNSASEKKLAYTQKKPIGVVLSISAFNHPINLAIHQIIPCIAAGCPVIYKPALSTPLTSKEIINSIYEAGLPEEWCTYLICDNETTSILAQSDLLGYISFIGSSEIGWSIKQKMAPGVRIVLEHGGIAPVVVAKDANLNNAVPQIVKAGFYHAGQVCVSAQRIFVHEEIIDKFISQLNLQAQVQKVGNPKSENRQNSIVFYWLPGSSVRLETSESLGKRRRLAPRTQTQVALCSSQFLGSFAKRRRTIQAAATHRPREARKSPCHQRRPACTARSRSRLCWTDLSMRIFAASRRGGAWPAPTLPD